MLSPMLFPIITTVSVHYTYFSHSKHYSKLTFPEILPTIDQLKEKLRCHQPTRASSHRPSKPCCDARTG